MADITAFPPQVRRTPCASPITDETRRAFAEAAFVAEVALRLEGSRPDHVRFTPLVVAGEAPRVSVRSTDPVTQQPSWQHLPLALALDLAQALRFDPPFAQAHTLANALEDAVIEAHELRGLFGGDVAERLCTGRFGQGEGRAHDRLPDLRRRLAVAAVLLTAGFGLLVAALQAGA